MALPLVFPFAFIVFIFLVVLLSKAVGKKALLLIPLVVMLIPALFWLRSRQMSHVSHAFLPADSAAPAVLGISEAPVARVRAVPAAPIWTEGIEDQFEADVYPSKEQATAALAGQTSFLLTQVMENNTAPTAATVFGESDITVQLLNTFADKLREQCNLAQVVVQTVLPSAMPKEPNMATIVLEMPKHQNQVHTKGSLSYALGSGTLRTRIHGTAAKALTRTAEFLEKPWVNNLGVVLNKHQDMTLAIARSNGSCTSQLEAQQQAMASARALVTEELQRLPRPHTVLTRELAVSDLDTKGNELIVDRFTQSFRGTAGRIWRQAILLDLSQQKLNQVLQTKVRRSQTVHRVWIEKVGSLLGLALIVLILYIFLNAATKGYYTITLKIVAFALVVVGIAAVVLG
jgi:hypothetical protein